MRESALDHASAASAASAASPEDTPLILAPENERSAGILAFLHALDAEFELIRHHPETDRDSEQQRNNER